MNARLLRSLTRLIAMLLGLAFLFASLRTSIERRGSVGTAFILTVFAAFLFACWRLWRMAQWVKRRLRSKPEGRNRPPIARSPWIRPRGPRGGIRP